MTATPVRPGAPPTTSSAAVLTAHSDGSLASALLQTDEVRRALGAVAPELLRAWAGTSKWRGLAAEVLTRLLRRGLAEAGRGRTEASLQTVLRDPDRARQIAAQLPDTVNAIVGASAAVSEGVALLPPQEKARLLGELLERFDAAIAGQLLTRLVRFLNEVEEAEPGVMAERLRPAVRAWLGSVDFGEIKTLVDSLADQAPALVGMINEELWEYPTKLVSLQATLPALLNATVRALLASLEPVNRQAPDMVADLVLALLRDVKGEDLGRLVTAACEAFRKLHTGSVLIGDNGKPQMPADLSALLGDMVHSIDIDLLLKTRALLADTQESTHSALLTLLEEQPRLVREMVADRFRRPAAALRRLARGTDLLERALGDDDIAAAVTSGIGEIDAQELADTLNRLLAIADRVHEASPELLRGMLTQIGSALDERQVGQTLRWVVEDLVAALAPVAHEVLPPLLTGLAELLASGARSNGELRSAIDALRVAIAPEEPTA